MATEEELRETRRKKAGALAEHGSQPYPNDFVATPQREQSRAELVTMAADEQATAKLPLETELGDDPHMSELYGRVVAKRGPFLVIRTPHGDAQALVRPDKLTDTAQAMLKQVDLADHVWVQGPLIRTKTGALAVSARDYAHLAKAQLPPPAKWHGLKDVEKRYRERYVDLFANPDVAQVFRARTLIVQALRQFLDARQFVEVETPLLHSIRGGATARPFNTHHNTLDLHLFLRIAPELYLKRLLVGGLDRVYEIGRAFRNEGISTKHNPEFTILEYYMAYATHAELMDMTVEMFREVDARLLEAFPSFGDDRPFDLSAPWKIVTMRQAILAATKTPIGAALSGLDEATLNDPAKFADVCQTAAPKLEPGSKNALLKAPTHGNRIFALFEAIAEPALTTLYRTDSGSRSVPVFITEYPAEVSPLARRNDSDPAWVDRFELFIEGGEISNAFSELNDPDDQAARFEAQRENRAAGDDEAMDFDADYVRALCHGMPPAAGFGLGVDRLVMLLTGQPSIRDVLLFPLLRPEAT